MSVLLRSAAAELLLDRAAVAANTRSFRARSEVMAVVKADGYGVGALAVAQAALGAGASRLGVTTVDEALTLRARGIDAPVLSWMNSPLTDFGPAVARGVEIAVPSLAHLLAMPAGARVHLHLDTGLARDGAAPVDWELLCAEAARAERTGRIAVVGVMSHLACADDPVVNRLQQRRFDEGVRIAELAGLRPGSRHLAATVGTLLGQGHTGLVRIGAGLLGIDPVGGQGLVPAVSLRAPLDGVRRVSAGTPVGYDHTWRAPRDTVLGRVGLGYADGIPRSQGLTVGFDGRLCPVVGRVSMDQTLIDLGPVVRPEMLVGEPVTLFGDGGPAVADWARSSGRLEAELLVGLGPRIRRTS